MSLYLFFPRVVFPGQINFLRQLSQHLASTWTSAPERAATQGLELEQERLRWYDIQGFLLYNHSLQLQLDYMQKSAVAFYCQIEHSIARRNK